jgi:predicted DNA-binding protein with PD1-like motif
MNTIHKLYIPAGQWVVESLTGFCQAHGIGNAGITGMGSITNVWVLLDPNGAMVVRNFSAGPSYEMTSLLGNVTLRQGMPRFDRTAIATGKYPQMDSTVPTYNCYAHLHVTFANPDLSISGGHLVDAQVSIGVEIVVQPMAGPACVPGLSGDRIPADCVTDNLVTIPPYGTFSNWDQRFWYPPPGLGKKS